MSIVIAVVFLIAAIETGRSWWQAMYRGRYGMLLFMTEYIEELPWGSKSFISLSLLGISILSALFGTTILLEALTGHDLFYYLESLPDPLKVIVGIPFLVIVVGGFLLTIGGMIWPFKLPRWLDPETRWEDRQQRKYERWHAEHGTSPTETLAPTASDPLAGPDPRVFRPTGVAWGTPVNRLPRAMRLLVMWLPATIVIYLLRHLLPPGNWSTMVASALIILISAGFIVRLASQLRSLPRAEEIMDPRAEAYQGLSERARNFYESLPASPAELLNNPALLEESGLDAANLAMLSLSDEEAATVRNEALSQAQRAHRHAIIICVLGILIFAIAPLLGWPIPEKIVGFFR